MPETPADGSSGSDNGTPDDSVPPPEAPSLADLPARYGYDTIPLRGSASPFETIFVEGGEAPVATDADGGGNFCIDVPLNTGKEQTLNVFAQDEQGQTSDPSSVVVDQDPSLAEVVIPPQPVVDLAPGLPVYGDETPKEGLLSYVTDQDPTTNVLLPESRLWIDLGDWYDIEKIEIEFPDEPMAGDDTFATEYMVLASDEAAPVMPPDVWDTSWTLLYDVYPGSFLEAGDGGVDSFELLVPMRARYVAFYLIENNKIDWFSSENIRVSEARVFGRSTEELPPEPQTPTCENGRAP
ncbi:MAG: hypothetical protein V3T05_08620 [Myxococcota bacterium]